MCWVGMPGSRRKPQSAKSLQGSFAAEFVDTDDLIKEKYGDISEIFPPKGRDYFRGIESEVIAETAKKCGLVIATGGGAVLKPQNIFHLRQNGKFIFSTVPSSR